MLGSAAALLVRIGLVLLVLAVLARLVRMPSRADVVADDFAIAVNLVLVLAASAQLRLSRGTAGRTRPETIADPDTTQRPVRRHV